MKIDWETKLTSRKFWLSVSVLVAALMMAFNANAGTVEKVTAIIAALADVCAYLFTEGAVDRARAGNGQ